MKVEIARYAGYCFGVKRAIDIAKKTLNRRGKDIYTLGQIIHNPGVVENLDKKGIHAVGKEKEIPEGSVMVIRSHGMAPSAINILEHNNVEIVDATCPYVKTAQRKAKLLSSEGYFVVLVGTKNHPEVIGIKEQVASDKILVAEKIEDLNPAAGKKKIGLLIQTTQTLDMLKKMADKILETAKELKIINTICSTTKERQNETVTLARTVDVMLVVGGKNSANTIHLADISRQVNKKTYHIQNAAEIDNNWFAGAASAGISGGASTPFEDILEAKEYIEAL
ncbi:MAG: 4-hydroxy-3-methylbut-2-enyl diphosphate reductase [Actinomycetota bacterium]